MGACLWTVHPPSGDIYLGIEGPSCCRQRQYSGCKEGGGGDKKEMVVGVNICGCNEEMSFDNLIFKKTVRGPYVIFR